jgi:O-antigen ligase
MITTVLLILFVLVWIPLLFYQLTNRAFAVFLVWLFIAPVVSNIVNYPDRNPFFKSPAEYYWSDVERVTKDDYFHKESEIESRHWFEPTRLLFICFVFAFILNSLSGQKRLEPFDKIEVGMALFVFILLASALLQSTNRIYSLRVVIDGFIIPFLAYFIARRLVTTETRLIQFSQVLIYMSVYLIVIGLIERLVHHDVMTYRLEGPFRNKHAIGITTILPFFIVLADTLYTGSIRAAKAMVSHSVRWFVLLLAPVIVVITMTRGIWLGFLLGLGVFVAIGGRMIDISRKMIALGLFLLLLPMAAILLVAITPPEIVQARVVGATSVYGRFATWDIALQAAAKSPLFGIGLNNLRQLLYNSELQVQGVNRYKSVHNSYLALFIEQGIVGLLVYLAIVTGIMRMGIRLYGKGVQPRERWCGVVVVAVMVAYLVPALFESKLHAPNAMIGGYVFAWVGSIAGLYGRRRVIAPGGVLRGDARHVLGGRS